MAMEKSPIDLICSYLYRGHTYESLQKELFTMIQLITAKMKNIIKVQ